MKSFTNYKKTVSLSGLVITMLFALAAKSQGTFTAGNLVVLQTTGNVSKASSPITLKEFTTNGTPGISVSIPSTGGTPIQTSGVFGGSEGFLTNATDNKFLLLGGYGTSSPFTDITATLSSAVPRVIGTVDPSGFYTQVGSSNTDYSANDIRGAISDGTNYWASGASVASVDGIDYYGPGAPAGLGTAATPPKAYGLRIFNGQIYYSTQKAGPTNSATQLGILALGSGLPTTNPVTITQVINTGTATPEDFSFNPTLNVCYIAINLNSSVGGIQKWTKSGSIWSLAYTLGTGVTNAGAYGLAVDYSGTNPIIYATTFEVSSAPNRVIEIQDTGVHSVATTIVAATTNVFYKGISFAPVNSCNAVSIASQPTSPAAVCSGSGTATFTVSVNGSGPFTYQWQENMVNISDAGVYSGTGTSTLTITNPTTLLNGNTYQCLITNCSGNNSVTTDNTATLTVNSAPSVTIIPTSATLCSGDNVTLSASGADSYSWQPGDAISASINVAPTVTTTYTVTGTASGFPPECSSSIATVTVQVNNTPVQPGDFITSSSTATQEQQGVPYTVPNDPSATIYSWNYSGTGATINGNGNSITVDFSSSATSGTLSVTASNDCGTSDPRSIVVTVLQQTSFTPGNLVVLQTSGTGSKASSPITLKEFAADGTPGISVSIPSTGTTPLQTSGVFGGSEGFLTTSTDNKYLLLGGFATSSTFGDITATASSAVPRAVGTVAPSGFYLQVGSSNTNYSGNDIRGAISDGTNYWASGASVANVDGIDYYGPGALAGLGTASPNPPKAYGLRIFNGQIFYSTQKAGPTNSSSQLGIFSLGSGLPTTNPVTITQVINTGTVIPEDFSFNPTLDVCYIAINLNTSAGGIQKWTKSGSVWNLAYTLGTGVANTGAYGLVVDYSGTNPIIYATTFDAAGNRVIKITDTGAGSVATTIVAASSNVFYKGISFAPVASGTPVVNLTVSTNTASEAAVTAVTVRANASAAVSGDQTISLGVSGTGITAGDYTLSNTTITIPNGATSSSVTFTVVDDAIFEGTETAVLTMSNPSAGIAFGINTSQSVTIIDNDVANNPPTISMNVSTTDFIDGGVSTPPASPFTASGVISDPTDPASSLGIDFTVNDPETSAGSLIVTTNSSNTSVVPNANVIVSGTDATRNVKITPTGVGYSTITVTVSDGANTASYIISYAASEASSTPASTLWHTGMSDASDAIALDDNYYISGDDELDVLNVYSRTASGLEVASYNYASFLALPDPGKPEVDVEAATRSTAYTNRVYWMGSMSNGKDPFDNKPNRDRLFATTVAGTGATTSFAVLGYGAIRSSLIAWGDTNGYDFSASAAQGVDSKTPSGFAAEGMVFGPDNATLYIGMRAPLVPTTNRTNAVIAPILNFETWFNNGAPSGDPTYGSPIELDLGLRGIRDLMRLSDGTYIILAGNPGSSPVTGALYKWTGIADDAPVLISSPSTDNLNIEGALQVNLNGQISLANLQVITDGGDEILYNDGNEAKDFGDLILRKFRSDNLTALDLCLATKGDTTAIACNSFTWYGTTYTSTPVIPPTHTLTNIGGCDSTVTLHLTVNQGTLYYADGDHDGFGSISDPGILLCTNPGLGYSTNNTDCNDDPDNGGSAVNPNANEVCNSIDDNCNGDIDEGVKNTFYADADGDGFGDPNNSTLACSAPSGYVSDNTDCNDDPDNGGAAVHPGASDICNGIDDNCNGATDENAITSTVSPTGTVTVCKGTSVTLTANSGAGITYQWLKNSVSIAGATGQVYVTTKKGDYQAMESNSFSCNSTSPATTISVNGLPAAIITPLGTLNICQTGSVVLKANGGAGFTYQWKNKTGNIAGATNRKYTATSTGNYKVIVTNSNNCSKTSTGIKVTNSCRDEIVAGQTVSSGNLLLYPNPTNGDFIVDLKLDDPSVKEAKVEVTNLIGQIIYTENAAITGDEMQKQISLSSSLASGVYTIRIIAGDKVYQGKLVYQK